MALCALGACSQIELGDAPFLCNNGDPPCPEGYNCVETGGKRICVRGSFRPDGSQTTPDVSVDSAPPTDSLMWLDGVPDTSADGPLTTWDLGPPDLGPDQKIKPDGIPPHLGCQTNKDCTDSSNPCCCPLPLIPGFWACMPVCLNPFCI